MFKRSLPALLLVITLATVHASYAIQEQHPDFSQLEKVVLEELKETNTPGAVVAIISGERVIYTKAFGLSNVETGAPMTPDMLFPVGSATQMFTATALVTLVEEGKLKLEEAIGKHVDGLNPNIAVITAHQLLTHTGGLIDDARGYVYHDDSALARTSRSWVGAMLFAEPGKIISYSPPGYSLAGFVVESISKKPFADQMSESIFKPLGMASTTFSPTVAMTHPLAQGHRRWGKSKPKLVRPVADNKARWPADSMFTSVLDLSRFIIAFMNGGKLEGRQVLSPAVIAKLSTPRVGIPGRPAAKYAYGLMIRNYRGVRVVGNVEHGDSRSGCGSVIMMVPEQRFAVIVLWNSVPNPSDKTAEKAMELMLPLKPREEDKPKKELPMTAAEMENCTGKYANLEILLKDGKLFLKQGPNELPIRKIGENLFSVSGLQFALVPGADGKAEYFHAGLRATKRTTPLRSPVSQVGIPEATEPSTAEEAKWWRELCEAVREFAAAGRRKDRAVAEARSQASKRRGRVLDDDDDGLSTKDRDKLDADIETTRQNYSRLLQERQDKSYRAPIRDARPTVLYNSYPTYTERARRNKTSGSVKLRVEFRADGKIGNVTVVRGLGDGLDEKAVEAVRRMVFLPATKDRVFVTFYVPIDADFSLR